MAGSMLEEMLFRCPMGKCGRGTLDFRALPAMFISCAPPARFSVERGGTRRDRADNELSQNNAIEGNRSSCKGFSITLRGFESRPGQ